MISETEETLRTILMWYLGRATRTLSVSELWRVAQNYGYETSYMDFELWLMEQSDWVEDVPTGGKRLCLNVVPPVSPPVEVQEKDGNASLPFALMETGSVQRLVSYAADVVREEGKAISAYAQTLGSRFLITNKMLHGNPAECIRVSSHENPDLAKNLSQGGQAAYYGFPLLLEWIETANGDFADMKITPVFVTRLQIQAYPDRVLLQADQTWPRLNPEIMNKAKAKDRGFISENLDSAPEKYESLNSRFKMVGSTLQQHRLADPISAYALRPFLDVKSLQREDAGIYNAGAVFAGEGSSYTQGLLKELAELKTRTETDLSQTALGVLVRNMKENASEESGGTLIAPLSAQQDGPGLNHEQEAAVQRAFSNRVSIVTGPPGTGKSQVVLSILLTATQQNKSVLFASRNHKAIEVVRDKLHQIADTPLSLLQLGGSNDKTVAEELSRMSALPVYRTGEHAIALNQRIRSTIQRLHDAERKITHYAELQASKMELMDERDRLWHLLTGKKNAVPAVEPDLLAAQLAEPFKQIKKLEEKIGKYPAILQRLLLRLKAKAIAPILEKWALDCQNALSWSDFQWPADKVNLHALYRRMLDLIQMLRVQQSCIKVENQLKELGIPIEIYQEILGYKSDLGPLTAEWMKRRFKTLLADHPDSMSVNEALQIVLNHLSRSARQRADENRKQAYAQAFKKNLEILPCWAVTNLSAAGRLPLTPGLFDLVVIDEASQCDIPSSLPLFYRAKHTVVIGDPLQLPPISNLSSDTESQLLRHHEMTDIRYDHLNYSRNSLFDAVRRVTPYTASTFLARHYRCHPDIIGFANTSHWYDQNLEVFTRLDALKRPHYWKAGVTWVDCSSNASNTFNRYYLKEEVDKVTQIVYELLTKHSYQGTVGVVSPFREMVDKIRANVERTVDARFLQAASFEAQTAHGFQGDERDVIVYAMGIHSEMARGSAWFVAENSNLFNVALSRARASFIVVGDKTAVGNFTFEGRPVKYLQDFVGYVNRLENPEIPSQDAGTMTDILFSPEQLWEKAFYEQVLLPLNAPVVSQYRLGPYRLDFALLPKGGARKLDIEVDGETWHKDVAGKRLKHDLDRDVFVMSQDGGSWDVMRFWVYEIRDELETCKARIQSWMKLNT